MRTMNPRPTAAQRLISRFIDTQAVEFWAEGEAPSGDTKDAVSGMSLSTVLWILTNPTFQVLETYMRGKWKLERGDLGDFLVDMSHSMQAGYNRYYNIARIPNYLSRHLKQFAFTRYFTRRVRHHYNIDEIIYSYLLGETWAYSCGFFENEGDTLVDAQDNKHRRAVERMNIQSNEQSILNIGCGWGGFERYMEKSGLKNPVTGLTIASNQQAAATAALGSDQFNFLVEDYLDFAPAKKFDRIISIGMAEHIGLSQIPKYMKRVEEFLAEDGIAVVHCMTDQHSSQATAPWIDKYIFPGGYIPSKKEVLQAVEQTGLHVLNMFTHHPLNYAQTVRLWRQNLIKYEGEIRQRMAEQSLSPRQIDVEFRKWEMYLASCEVAFKSKTSVTSVTHFVLKRL